MKKFYGNYLGLCIDNNDPQKRGRVQVFIPHIMPALFENWNEVGEDIKMLCVGDNLPDSLPSSVVEKLMKILPWAESASPILGASSPGNLISQIGSAIGNFFNPSPVPSPAGEGGNSTPNADEQSLFNNAAKYGPVGSGKFSRSGSDDGDCGRGSRQIIGALTNNSYFSKGIGGTGSYGGLNSAYAGSLSTGNPYLQNSGYYNTATNIPSNYTPKIGDVVAGTKSGGAGHVQVYIGNGKWVSDHTQNSYYASYGNLKLHQMNDVGLAAIQKASPSLYAGTTPAEPGTGLERTSTSGQVSAPTPHQDENSLELDINKNNYGNIAKPEVTLDAPVSLSLGPESNNSSSTGSQSRGSLGSLINPKEVVPAGDSQTRKVSVYGSIFNDFTTYLDVKPEQRPPEATAYWQNKGYNIPKQEAGLAARLRGWKPILNLQDTGRGAFLAGQGQGNLTPGFSVAIPSNNAYGLKPGGFLYVTNSAGQPVGPNGGYFQVADKGNSQNLVKLNALDFYSGNDPSLKEYFKGLGSENLKVQPVDITGQSAEQLKQALAQQTNAALESTTLTDTSRLAGAAGEDLPTQQGSGMVQNTDKHGAMAVVNLNNMAKGVFSYPAAGAVLWVFFREGDPNFPVYFAANYGEREWQSAYRQGSEAPGMKPAPTPDNSTTSTGGMMNLNGVGGMRWEDTTVPEDPTKDQKSLTIFGYDGSNMHFNEGYHQIFSKFDRRDSVEGDRWETTLGFKEEWVQGDSNEVCMGDVFVKIGNVSPPAVDAVTRIQQIIKECMEPITQNTECPEPSSSTQGKSKYTKQASKNKTVKDTKIAETPSEILEAQSKGLGEVALKNQEVLQQVGAASASAGANVSVQQADRYARFGNAIVSGITSGAGYVKRTVTETIASFQE
jgi:hypothetical protein